MLRTVRKNIKSLSITLWLVIASFIATIFLVYGMQSAGPGRSVPVAATVNGERIPMQEFQQAFRRQKDTLRRIYGDQWKDDQAMDLGIRHQVLDSLITSRLLLQEAERVGLTVSREELALAIRQNPQFAADGKFSPERYRQLLDANRLTPERYEASVRQALLLQKLATLVQASAKVSAIESRETFEAAKETFGVAYVSLPRSEENKTRLDNLRGRASQKGTPWKTLMQNSGLKPKEPKPFVSGAAVVDPLDAQEFHLAILRLKAGETSPVVTGGKSYFLIHLVERKPPTQEAYEKEKETWMEQLLSEKRSRIWATWVHELKRRAQIDIAQELA
jgi:parvulin-like peptidyl-prolyl isomerase